MQNKFVKLIPNLITVFRTILAPFVLYSIWISHSFLSNTAVEETNSARALNMFGYLFSCMISLLFFIFVALLDRLDGVLARKFDAVTSFGKFLDPLADKLLICGALIVLCIFNFNLLFIILVSVIILREIFITVFRILVIKKRSLVIPADKYGKLKTVFQSVAVGFFIAPLKIMYPLFTFCGYSLLIISSALAIISAINYLRML